MILLLDQGLPRSTVQFLSALGVSCQHVGDLGMSHATDAAILAFAKQQDWIIVTLDADFHSILAVSGAAGPSVIRIRIEGFDGQQLAALLADVLQVASAELASGALVSVTAPNMVRIRSLPIH